MKKVSLQMEKKIAKKLTMAAVEGVSPRKLLRSNKCSSTSFDSNAPRWTLEVSLIASAANLGLRQSSALQPY